MGLEGFSRRARKDKERKIMLEVVIIDATSSRRF